MPLRILIVDDNRDAADSLALLVDLWGHTVTVAYDGEAGLRAASEWRPECLILDINMPGLDGYTLAAKVRQQPGLEGAKLVAVSATARADHARRAAEAGFDFRLTKSADPSELKGVLDMTEQILKLARETEQLAQRNVAAAERTEAAAQRAEALTGEAKELLREVRDELKEVRQGVAEIKEEIKDVRERVDRSDEGDAWKNPPDGE